MTIGKLPQPVLPMRPPSLAAAPNPGRAARATLGATMHSVTNVPTFPTGRVSSLIRLYGGGAADEKQVAGTPLSTRAPSSEPSSAYSSGYASRSSSVCSDAPPLGERLRSALSEHLTARMSAFDAESDFSETYTAEEMTAMEQRFNDEEADIARADRAFEAKRTAPSFERLRVALEQHLSTRGVDLGNDSDFDEEYSDEEMAAFSLRFDKEGQDIERAERAFEAQRLDHAGPAASKQEINAVHAQLMDVLNRRENETRL